jgi:hypothetical protein
MRSLRQTIGNRDATRATLSIVTAEQDGCTDAPGIADTKRLGHCRRADKSVWHDQRENREPPMRASRAHASAAFPS